MGMMPALTRSLLRALALLALLATVTPGSGADATDTTTLDEVLVTGERPGPAMWKVSKGDHTLWIMGTLSPLPAKMTWKSKQAEEVISGSGEILAESVSSYDMDMGFREAFGVLRAMMRARHNPDGSTLREALPQEIYDRWHTAHRQWFGKAPDRKERARPSYAAFLLYEQALKKSGLTEEPIVWSAAERIAKRHDVKIRRREFTLKVENPRGMVDELATLSRDTEIACLVATMNHIDSQLPDMKRRAQAWATGNLMALRALPPATDRACEEDLGGSTSFMELFEREQAQFRADWPGIVDWLLLVHETSFTTLPIADLLDPEGPLAALRAKGYQVLEPT
jgi:uncharacterized protein YbaP (TraB family)